MDLDSHASLAKPRKCPPKWFDGMPTFRPRQGDTDNQVGFIQHQNPVRPFFDSLWRSVASKGRKELNLDRSGFLLVHPVSEFPHPADKLLFVSGDFTGCDHDLRVDHILRLESSEMKSQQRLEPIQVALQRVRSTTPLDEVIIALDRVRSLQRLGQNREPDSLGLQLSQHRRV